MAEHAAASVRRVLVFGSSGAGKTSLCNELTGADAPIGSSVLGITFQSSESQPVIYDGETYVFTDTVGLNESTAGRVPAPDAIRALVKLLRSSRMGYNLLIHVVRAGRYTEAERNNYRLFVETITGERIPVLLVATGCEGFKPMRRWRDENVPRLRDELGVDYTEVVCASFARGEWSELEEIYKVRRAESLDAAWRAVHDHATEEPVVIYRNPSDFERILKRTWNDLCRLIGWRTLVVPVNAALQAFLVTLGFGRDEAQDMIERENL